MRASSAIGLLALLVVAVCALPARGQVEGRIRRVGLFEGASPTVRSGAMSFAEVELRWFGGEPFEGELRINQQDRDGDVVTAVQPVALAPDGQWRPYEVYFVPNTDQGADRVHVRLFDSDGRLVRIRTDTGEEASELVSPFVMNAPSADELLILDLTVPRKLPHVTCLDTRWQHPTLERINARTVRPLSPRRLPSRMQGLESVDAIVWDDADPSQLNAQQIEALIGWGGGGGPLLLTAGGNWQRLDESPLKSILPVAITGMSQVGEVQEFTEDILRDVRYAARLEVHYSQSPITRCKMIRLPSAIGIPARSKGSQPIAYRRLVGRGSITFVGATLQQLLPPPAAWTDGEIPKSEELDEDSEEEGFLNGCEKVVAWNFLGLPKTYEDTSSGMVVMSGPVDLFGQVRETVGFQEVGAWFLIFAIFFSGAYWAFATMGSHFYLKRKGLAHHSWTAFAGISLLGVVIGTGMVWTLRGVTTKLWQTTVVDAKAGESAAHATCLFGVKTPDHTNLDLRLPVGAEDASGSRRYGMLRVMPQATSVDAMDTSKFVAPGHYKSAQAGAFVGQVPIRATLKEFHGRWHGQMAGALDARLVVHPKDFDRFGKGSYIRNNLGVDLHNCYILEGKDEIAGSERVVMTRCLVLGELPKSGPGSELDAAALRDRLYLVPLKRGADADAEREEISPIQLRLTGQGGVIRQWRGQLGSLAMGQGTGDQKRPRLSLSQAYASVLLLSVYDLLEPDPNGRQALRRSHGRTLDCTHQITRETAVLIGYSNEPSPAVLEVDRVNLNPERALTVYRIVIEVDRE